MLYYKVKKYLSDKNIDIEKVKKYFDLRDLSDGNGQFIKDWNKDKIGCPQPKKDLLNAYDEQELYLKEKIERKLKELDNYHLNSSEIRTLKVNNYYEVSLSGNGRALVYEQIGSLEQQVKLGLTTEENASFEYFFNGSSITMTLNQLRQLYVHMLYIVNTNYGIYKNHINSIQSLSTEEEIESYDFTIDYLRDQNLNLSL